MESKKIKQMIQAVSFTFKLSWETSPLITIISIIVDGINNFLPLIATFLWKDILDKIQLSYETMEIHNSLGLLIITYIILLTLQKTLNFSFSIVNEYLGGLVQQKLNLQLMSTMSELECEFYDNPENKDLLNAVNQYKSSVSSNTSHGLHMFMLFISLVIGIIMFIPYNFILGIIYIMTFIPGSIARYKASITMDYYSIDSIPDTRKKDYYRSILTERDYAKDLRLYNLTDYIKTQFRDSWNIIRKERASIFVKGTWAVFANTFISYFGFVLILAWGIYSVYIGKLTIGALSMFVALANTVNAKFNTLTFIVPYFANFTAPNILKYNQFVNNIPEESSDTEKVAVSAFPTVEFRNVCFKYPGCDDYVINHLDFKIESKEKVALIGVNGSGKSTIIKLLLRFYEPQEGQILLDGKDIKFYSIDSVRKLFSVCFQDIIKYSLTFRENIAVSNIDDLDQKQKIEAAAFNSGADEIYKAMAHGLDSNLTRNFDDNGYELSVGQWQKIALARTFFRNSDIIILDEPSSALDPEAEDFIFKKFVELFSDKGGILVSHRLSSVKMVDKVIMIEKGSLLDAGTHSELMNRCEKYAMLYNMQADKYKIEVNK